MCSVLEQVGTLYRILQKTFLPLSQLILHIEAFKLVLLDSKHRVHVWTKNSRNRVKFTEPCPLDNPYVKEFCNTFCRKLANRFNLDALPEDAKLALMVDPARCAQVPQDFPNAKRQTRGWNELRGPPPQSGSARYPRNQKRFSNP